MKRGLMMLFVVACLGASGCVALVVGGAAGAAGTVWYEGALVDTISKPVPVVQNAMLAGLKDLHITVNDAKSDSLEGHIYARLANGDKVAMKLEAVNDNTTKLALRVGLMGDKAMSERILAAGRNHL
ncbi:MAG: DUF3568 family protein [Actinomycetota bacterium]|nr:DUF3568 family protein [Nitrospiraceae bacterium]MDA8157142.1 DUF3568 family protein [Actinomycetota bacterium]